MDKTPLQIAIARCGGTVATAALIGASHQVFRKWIQRGFPAIHAARLDIATGGILSRKLTRPNDWRIIWPELSAIDTSLVRTRRKRVAGTTESGTVSSVDHAPIMPD